jgi:hypothetical protein
MSLVAAAPASAEVWTPDLTTFTFDCNNDLYEDWDLPLYNSSVTLEFDNCSATIVDFDLTGNASTVEGTLTDNTPLSANTVTVTGEVVITLLAEDNTAWGTVEFIEPWELPDPNGAQVATGYKDFSATPLAGTWGSPAEVSDGSEIQIGGIDGCDILPGEHVYETQTFVVSSAGEYTFRVTGVDPYPYYLNRLGGADYELKDPMVALYSAFSVSDPSEGIVGCNDDLNDLVLDGHDYEDNDFNISEQGDFIEGHYSYFSATLEPGEYTLVFTTWDDVSADDWAAGDPNSGRIYFDAWGPSNGLVLTDGPSASSGNLADTGVEPTFTLWSALTLVSAGAVLMAARRRRERV